MISDIRRIVYRLKEDFGFRIIHVTMDGFQSTDTMQQLRKKKYKVDYVSVDRSTLPYEDLREAIYDRRLDFPPYETYITQGADKPVQITVQELQQLTDTGSKIDHPKGGSKDVADAMAGVVTTLMGDRSYRKGVRSSSSTSQDDADTLKATGTTGFGENVINFPGMDSGLKAPAPSGGTLGLTIPRHLQPTRKR